MKDEGLMIKDKGKKGKQAAVLDLILHAGKIGGGDTNRDITGVSTGALEWPAVLSGMSHFL